MHPLRSKLHSSNLKKYKQKVIPQKVIGRLLYEAGVIHSSLKCDFFRVVEPLNQHFFLMIASTAHSKGIENDALHF